MAHSTDAGRIANYHVAGCVYDKYDANTSTLTLLTVNNYITFVGSRNTR